MALRQVAREAIFRLVERARSVVMSSGGGQVLVTVWVPGRVLTEEEQEEVHDLVRARWGGAYVASVVIEAEKKSP